MHVHSPEKFAQAHKRLSVLDLQSHLSSPSKIQPELEREERALCHCKKGYNWFKEDFVFHFYVSFPDRKGAVGLDICEAVQKFNRRYGFTNFKLIARVTNEIPKGTKVRRTSDKSFIGDFLKDCHVKTVD